jgi:polynucleotide 5'-kinase involved in rRNA processing
METASLPQGGFRFPFGEESCEHEFKVLQDEYKRFYYNQSRFNTEALEEDVYLIVGRRGSGKTSLTKYFGFQEVSVFRLGLRRYESGSAIQVEV